MNDIQDNSSVCYPYQNTTWAMRLLQFILFSFFYFRFIVFHHRSALLSLFIYAWGRCQEESLKMMNIFLYAIVKVLSALLLITLNRRELISFNSWWWLWIAMKFSDMNRTSAMVEYCLNNWEGSSVLFHPLNENWSWEWYHIRLNFHLNYHLHVSLYESTSWDSSVQMGMSLWYLQFQLVTKWRARNFLNHFPSTIWNNRTTWHSFRPQPLLVSCRVQHKYLISFLH